MSEHHHDHGHDRGHDSHGHAADNHTYFDDSTTIIAPVIIVLMLIGVAFYLFV